jgi:hypothetical protein
MTPDMIECVWTLDPNRHHRGATILLPRGGVTMRTLVRFTLIMALALLTGAPAAAGQEMGKAAAKLTGDAEVRGQLSK